MNETECIYFLTTLGIDVKRLYDPDRWLLEIDDTLDEFKIREKFINRYGFAILTRGAIEEIRPYAPLLELGAGSGYWSYELQNYGIDVIATDPRTEMFRMFKDAGVKEGRWPKSYTTIETINSVDAVRKYPDRNLLIVWPSLGDSWAADALRVFTGQVVVYMGEGAGDACAEDRFFDLLDQRFSDQVCVRMPHFWGLYDRYLKICKQPKQLIEGTK